MVKYLPPKLYIHGDISEESYSEFSKSLAEIESEAPANFKGYIDIELSSEGGNAYDALAFFDRIKGSRLKTRITGTGLVASAAVLVLAAGNKRRLTKNAWVMVHEDTPIGLEDLQVHEVEKLMRHYRKLEIQWCELLASTSSSDVKCWSRLHKEESYLSAKDCIILGLIEEIV